MRSTCGVWAPGKPPQTRKQRKTVQNSVFGAKTSRYSSKFKLLNSKFEFQAFWCIPNLNYYIYETSAKYGRRGGLHRRENSEKQRKTVFFAFFQILPSRRHLRSMGPWVASTDEKTAKNVENSAKQRFWRQNEPLQLKIQILNSKFEFQAPFCSTNLTHYICEAPVKYGRRGGLHRLENS